ncbi:MAG: hypothetical protein SWO11_07780 [Thermodesulfobacteriota bacterium]|nr:hypothetical protein [Thermodesulfobacteriota bacterium]
MLQRRCPLKPASTGLRSDGVYHSDATALFTSVNEYLTWCGNRINSRPKTRDRPRIKDLLVGLRYALAKKRIEGMPMGPCKLTPL